MVSEAHYARKVMETLRSMPEVGFCRRVESGASSPGIPDVFLLYQGHTVWVELKRQTGKLRPSQQLWHREYRKAGGIIGHIMPQKERETVKELKQYLKETIEGWIHATQ